MKSFTWYSTTQTDRKSTNTDSMSHPYLCPSARLCNSGSSVGGRDIRRMDVTFYLLAHGGQIDVLYIQSVNEEALMCRLSILKNRRIRKQRVGNGFTEQAPPHQNPSGQQTNTQGKEDKKKRKWNLMNWFWLIWLVCMKYLHSFILNHIRYTHGTGIPACTTHKRPH